MLILGLRPDQVFALAGIFWILGIIFFFSLRELHRTNRSNK